MITAQFPRRFLSISLACVSLAACATQPAKVAGLKPGAEPTRSASNPDASLYGLFLAGQAALDKGSSREAADYLERASALAPDAGFLRERAFTAALVTGDIDRAAALAPGPDEGGPGAQRLGVLARSVAALSEGHGKEAYALLSVPVAAGAPHIAATELLKPWAAASAGDWAAATTAPGAGADDKLIGVFGALGRAQLLERAGKLADAEVAYKALLPDRQGIFALSYGAFLERRGRRPEAIALYQRLLARNLDTALLQAKARAEAGKSPPPLQSVREGAAQALIGPAALLMASRSGDMGLAYLRLALKLDPKLDEAWVLVGDAMARAGDVTAARDSYRRVRPASSEYLVARGRLAWSLYGEGDHDGALLLARESVDANPANAEALEVYADLLRESGRFTEAVAVLDRLIGQPGGTGNWRLFYTRGVAQERAGHWDDAQTDLQKALKLNPESAETLNYLGFGWADRGEHLKQALEMLQKAVNLSPRSGAILDSLGWARYRNGDYRQAVRDLERAVLLEPSDPDINDHLGDAYFRTGRKLEAEFQWRRVLTLDPSDAIRTAIDTKLKDGLGPAPPIKPVPAPGGVTAQGPTGGERG